MTTLPAQARDEATPDTARLGSRLPTALEPVFEGDWPIVATDSRDLLSWLLDEGVEAQHFSHLADLTPDERRNVLVVPTTVDGAPDPDRWRELFAESRLLIVPGVAFDPSMEAMRYTLRRLAEASINDAVERNTRVLNAVAQAESVLVTSGGHEMRCRFDEVTILRPKIEPELERGEWESIGAYFEVGLVSEPDEFMANVKPGFHVDGEFLVNGVSVACHRHVSNDVRAMSTAAWTLLRDVHRDGGFPLRITLDHSVVRSIMTGQGRDLVSDLLPHTNAGLGGVLTELSFSTNSTLRPDGIDWTINSQMNEGALGVHVAIGEGLTGAHVDFIATGATSDITPAP
ncbi:MAG: hypothetical protein ACFCVF_06000 [Kineosporiaceae bacterium]